MPGMFTADDVDESTPAPAPSKRGKFSVGDIDPVKPKRGKFAISDIDSRPRTGAIESPNSSDQADADRPASAQPPTSTPAPQPKVKYSHLDPDQMSPRPGVPSVAALRASAQIADKPLLPIGAPAEQLAKKLESSGGVIDPRKQTMLQILDDVGVVGAKVAEGLSTPKNLAILGAMAALPEAGAFGVAKRLVDVKFGYDQLKAAIEEFKAGVKAYHDGDTREARRHFLSSGVQALFSALGAKGALREGESLGDTYRKGNYKETSEWRGWHGERFNKDGVRINEDGTPYAEAPKSGDKTASEPHENEQIPAEYAAEHDEFTEILNAAGVKLPKNATIGQARKAYAQAMRNLHPDTAEGDVASFDAHALSSLFSRLKKAGVFPDDPAAPEVTPEVVKRSMGDRLAELWQQFVTAAKKKTQARPKPDAVHAEPPQLPEADFEFKGKPHREAAETPVAPPEAKTPADVAPAAQPATAQQGAVSELDGRLENPELINYAITAPNGDVLVPVGGSRKSGSGDGWPSRALAEQSLAAIKGNPGFPNARILDEGNGFYSVQWGDPVAWETGDHAAIGKQLGYKQSSIDEFLRQQGATPEAKSGAPVEAEKPTGPYRSHPAGDPGYTVIGSKQEPVVAERPETVQHQVDALREGRIPVVMIPLGGEVPIVPAGFAKTVVKSGPGAGTYIYDPAKVTWETIRAKAATGRHGELLGHLQTKEDLAGKPTVVVQAVDRATGVPIQDSEVAASDPAAIDKQKQVMAGRHPEAEVVVKAPEQVKADRTATQSDGAQGRLMDKQDLRDTLPPGVTAYASGANRAADIFGFAKAGIPVGVAIPDVNENSMKMLEQLADRGVPVFADSGAFAEVTFGPDGPTVTKPITDAQWDEILSKYERLSVALKGNLTVVAPDQVGNQEVTLERLKKYAGQMMNIAANGSKVIVPMQVGDMSPAEFYEAAKDALNDAVRIIPGLPMKKAATNPGTVLEFVREVKPEEIHFLGLGVNNALADSLIRAVRDLDPNIKITMDANAIRAHVGEGRSITEKEREYRMSLTEGVSGEVNHRPWGGDVHDYTEKIYAPSEWASRAALERIARDGGLDADETKAFLADPDKWVNEEDLGYVQNALDREYENYVAEKAKGPARSKAVHDTFADSKLGGQAKEPRQPPPLKIGDTVSIMSVPSTLSRTHTDDMNMRYDLFTGVNDPRASVVVTDLDSGEVAKVVQYPTLEMATEKFDEAVKATTPEPEAEVAPVEPEPAVDESGEPIPKFKFGSTQTTVPPDSEAATALTLAQSRISDSDLAGKGKDVGGFHVTVRYGVDSDDVDGIREFLKAQPPFEATLGKTAVFDPTEQSDNAAVVIAPIEAPDLHRINAEVEEHGDFTKPSFAEYKPHATIAYVKPDRANRYVGMAVTEGKKFKIDRVAITDRFGHEEIVRLEGKKIEPAEVMRVPTGSLVIAPKIFQYKLNVDETGVTNILKGRKWNDLLAGIISVWYDPKTETTYVVNGHHRVQLAKENGVPSLLVRYIPADNAIDARTIGALQNISEGSGNAIDAAKFFRDTGYKEDELARQGITLTQAVAENGIALSRLAQPIFDEVAFGKMKVGRGVAIGRTTDDPAQQEAILKLIKKKDRPDRPVPNSVVEELGRMVKGAKEHTESQDTLFGVQEMSRNLMLEKAEVSDYIRKKISSERRLFANVADAGKAETLGKAGNVINAENNADIAQQAAQAQELYDRLSTRAGEIDDILNRASEELADGDNPNETKQAAYEAARTAISKILSPEAPGTSEGVQENPTAGFDFGAGADEPAYELYTDPATGELSTRIGMNRERGIRMTITGLYTDRSPAKMTVEMLQNAFDEVLQNPDPSKRNITYESGRWDPGNSPNAALNKALENETDSISYIKLTDTGRGMTPEQLGTVFTDVYESGKAEESGAAGGWGVAKTSFQLGGKYFRAVSTVDVKGELRRYVMEGTPEELLKGVPIKEVPLVPAMNARTGEVENFSTGMEITTWTDQGTYSADEYFENAAKSATAKVNFFIKARYRNTPEKIEPIPLKMLGKTETKGGQFVLRMAPPQKGLSDYVQVRVMNQGLYQFDFTQYVDKTPGMPLFLTADVVPSVRPGDPEYPFTQSREQMLASAEKAIKDFINTNLLARLRDLRRADLVKQWNQIQEALFPRRVQQSLFAGAPEAGGSGEKFMLSVYDEGGLMEARKLLNTPYWHDYLGVVHDAMQWFHNRFTKESNKPVQKLGVFFPLHAVEGYARSVIYGVNIPNPEGRGEGIFLNPLGTGARRDTFDDGHKFATPIAMARHQWNTILHEFAHNAQRSHGESHNAEMADLNASIPLDVEFDFVARLARAIAGENGDINGRPSAEYDEAVQRYLETRRKNSRDSESLGGTGINAKQLSRGAAESRGQGRNAQGVRRGGKEPESLVFPGFEDAIVEQAEAAARAQAEALAKELASPKGSIDRRAGEMEINSPLFAGTEASPQTTMFGGAPEAPATDLFGNAVPDEDEGKSFNLFEPSYHAERANKKVQTESPEFKRWFGDSKVVDESGKPMVVYHGSFDAPFYEFSDRFGMTAHFGDKDTALTRLEQLKEDKSEEFRGMRPGKKYLIPVYLSIKNPVRMRDVHFDGAGEMVDDLVESGAMPETVGINLRDKWDEDYPYDEESMKDVNDYLRGKGYDGIVYGNYIEGGGTDTWIPFNPTQIKSATENSGAFDPNEPSILYHQEFANPPEPKPTWYLKSERLVTGIMPNKARGETVLNMLQNNGVKADELKWSGLDDFLKSKESVTKQEVLDYIKANAVQVQEVMRPARSADEIAMAEYDKPYSELDAAGKRWVDDMETPEPKFASYQTPGGENYRELLLTLPYATNPENVAPSPIITAKYSDQWAEMVGRKNKLWVERETALGSYDLARSGELSTQIRQIDDEIDALHAKMVQETVEMFPRTQRQRQNFTGGHFDEPNVLAHIRFNDRTDADGKKVLFIEEIQSDWHQKGRKQGYKPESDAEVKRLDAERLAAWREMLPLVKQADNLGFDSAGEVGGALASNQLKPEDIDETGVPGLRDAARKYIDIAQRHRTAEKAMEGGVPDAPFKKDWHELALRRMLRYAAENGYDRIAWTTGEIQNDRYNLAKYVEEIKWEKFGKDKYDIQAVPKNESENDIFKQGLSANELADFIGKDAADKIINSPDNGGSLTGENLKVGGKGMTGFYDKIIPDYLNKYGKKWGAKVGETKIDVTDPDEYAHQYIGPDRTVEEVEKVYELSKKRGNTMVSPITGEKLLFPLERVSNEENLRLTLQSMKLFGNSFEAAMSKTGDYDVAEIFGGKLVRVDPDRETATVPKIDITPSMRESVMQGQSMYAGFDPTIIGDLFPNVGQMFDNWVSDRPDFGDEQKALMRQTRGEHERRVAVAMDKLKDIHKEWARRKRDDFKALANVVDGVADMHTLSEHDQELARLLKSGYDPLKREIEALKPEMAEIWLKDYFARIWKRPSRARKYIERGLAGKRPFGGAAGFRKQRSVKIPTTADGIALGLEPVSWNPVDLFMLKFYEMSQFLMAHKTLDMMKKNGLAEPFGVHETRDGWSRLDDRFATISHLEEIKSNDGETLFDKAGKPKMRTVITGYYQAPTPAAKAFNNYVSTGLAGRSVIYDGFQWFNNNVNALQLGISAFHFTTTSVNVALSDVALGIQQMYRGGVKPAIELLPGVKGDDKFDLAAVGNGILSAARGMTLAPAVINTFRNGGKIAAQYLSEKSRGEFEREARAIELAGGRHHMNTIEIKPLAQLVNALHNGAILEASMKVPAAIIELTTKPVMEWYVPRMKFGAFYQMAHDILAQADKENWPMEKIRARMQQAWDSDDNRFGQMVYDNKFWPKMMRDIMQALWRAVGWNFGTIMETMLGAASDTAQQFARFAKDGTAPDITDRMAFTIAMWSAIGMMIGTLNYLNGHRPKKPKDYYYIIKKDGTYLSVPGYVKDQFSYAHDWKRTLINKMSPGLEMLIEALENRDFEGEEIIHKDDIKSLGYIGGVWQWFKDYAEWFAKTVAPFSLTNTEKLLKKEGEDTSTLMGLLKGAAKHPGDVILGNLGFGPAPKYIQNSEAMNEAKEYQLANRPAGTRTHAAAAHMRDARFVEDMYRENRVDDAQIHALVESGRLTPQDVKSAQTKASKDPIVLATESLHIDQLFNVYKVADEHERELILPIIAKKYNQIRGVQDERQRMQLLRLYDEATKQQPEQVSVH